MTPASAVPVLVSVNVGLPKNVAWQGKTVCTGIWKSPVTGPAMVRRLNIEGDGNVLDLADACDVPSRWSCRTGVCHTCVTPLMAGEVTYSPAPLDPPDAGQVLICCARPSSDVVLDM